MSSLDWPIKKRRRRRTDWDQIYRLATAGGRTLRQLSDEYHIPYGTLLNRSHRERWMVSQIQSSKSAGKGRSKVSQELAGVGATNNHAASHDGNGVSASASLHEPFVKIEDLSARFCELVHCVLIRPFQERRCLIPADRFCEWILAFASTTKSLGLLNRAG